jgi:hypothetical protein
VPPTINVKTTEVSPPNTNEAVIPQQPRQGRTAITQTHTVPVLPAPPAQPYRVEPSQEQPSLSDSFLTTDGKRQFLGRYASHQQAQFAGELAVLLKRTLTATQWHQQDIRLNPGQLAQIRTWEQGFPLDEATDKEIKDEVALQLLRGDQDIHW